MSPQSLKSSRRRRRASLPWQFQQRGRKRSSRHPLFLQALRRGRHKHHQPLEKLKAGQSSILSPGWVTAGVGSVRMRTCVCVCQCERLWMTSCFKPFWLYCAFLPKFKNGRSNDQCLLAHMVPKYVCKYCCWLPFCLIMGDGHLFSLLKEHSG